VPDTLTVEANTTNYITAFDVREKADSVGTYCKMGRTIKHVNM
jgi:hypothetical protein